MDFFDVEISEVGHIQVPSGKHTKNYGKSPFFMGKFTISMVIFHSSVKLPEGKSILLSWVSGKRPLGLPVGASFTGT